MFPNNWKHFLNWVIFSIFILKAFKKYKQAFRAFKKNSCGLKNLTTGFLHIAKCPLIYQFSLFWTKTIFMVAYKQHMALAGVPFSSEQLLQLMMHQNIMKDKGLHKQILNSISFNFFEKKTSWKPGNNYF